MINEDEPTERLVLTVTEAGLALGLSRNSAYEAVARGEIPSIKVGRRVLVPKAALKQMLDATAKASGKAA